MIILISDLFSTLNKLPITNKKTVAFIPNAKDGAKDKTGIEKQRAFLQENGYTLKDVDLNRYKDEKLYRELKKYGTLYVAGGNCFVLLERMRDSGFTRIIGKLIKEGIVYIGQSAGACVAGPSIEPLKKMDNPEMAKLESYGGLGFIDFVFLPHYKNAKYSKAIAGIEKEYGQKFILKKFTDSEGCIIEGRAIRKIG
ncbi:Type 1 glutamine amidotransferase-like domain-containing protein [Candidatus Woesearchaeota archaeon]|nr:Type 1 glutamine amidotransferase-like domain-containing protein [Candidatus Woesearchaeota archaeon]